MTTQLNYIQNLLAKLKGMVNNSDFNQKEAISIVRELAHATGMILLEFHSVHDYRKYMGDINSCINKWIGNAPPHGTREWKLHMFKLADTLDASIQNNMSYDYMKLPAICLAKLLDHSTHPTDKEEVKNLAKQVTTLNDPPKKSDKTAQADYDNMINERTKNLSDLIEKIKEDKDLVYLLMEMEVAALHAIAKRCGIKYTDNTGKSITYQVGAILAEMEMYFNGL